MAPHVIHGETIPLERFPTLLRECAGRVGRIALFDNVTVPVEVLQIMDATDEELRIVQLRNVYKYSDIDRWEQRLVATIEGL